MAAVTGGARDTSSATPTFTITNFSEKIALDANTAALADVADTLATLIRELGRKHIINSDIA